MGFALKLHSDLDQVKWVSGTACHNQSYASFNETLETLADWVLGSFEDGFLVLKEALLSW